MNNDSLLCTDKEFSEIYERNIKRVYQICFLHLKNKSDSEDAAQTVFLKYLQSQKVFNDAEHEKAWFIVTTKNYCMDTLRNWWHSRRDNNKQIEDIPYHDAGGNSYLLDELLALPKKYKIVLYLYYFEGYSVKELSKLLNRNESTLRTQLQKGRERLKINLGGYYE